MIFLTVQGKELATYVAQYNANVDNLAGEIYNLKETMVRQQGQEISHLPTQDSIKRRLYRWFRSGQSRIKIKELEQLFAVIGCSLLSYPHILPEELKNLRKMYSDEIVGQWWIYLYTRWWGRPQLQEQTLNVWPSEDENTLHCYIRQENKIIEKPELCFSGKAYRFLHHISFELEMIEKNSPRYRAYYISPYPFGKHKDTVLTGLVLSVNIRGSLRCRFWIASQQRLVDPETGSLKEAEKIFAREKSKTGYDDYYAILYANVERSSEELKNPSTEYDF